MTTMLALVGEAYGGAGGIGQYNRDLMGALARLGGRKIRILPRHGAPDAIAPQGIEQAPPLAGRIGYILRAVREALRLKPDLIFCGHLFMAPLASVLARLSGAKLIIQLHGIEAWETPGPLVRKAVAQATLVLCVSRYTRDQTLAWADIAAERVVVLPNTVGADFRPGERAAARARWALGDRPVLLSVGRLDPRERYKGQDRVIAALAQVKAAGLSPLYLIAGDGDDLPRLEALAAEMGVVDEVRFMGRVAGADLPDLYRAADLFVLPSTGEGFGIVFLEAMASGTNALGLAAGGAVDALCPGELGTAVAESDLAPAIIALLRRPASADLPAKVMERFGVDAFTARVDAIFKRLSAA